MNNERKLSKLDILVSFIRNFKAFLPALLIFLFKIDEIKSKYIIYVLIGAASILLINLLFSYLPWKHFKFILEDDRIIVHKGVFKKEQKTIYYQRIHSVNVQQPILLRIFGAASLQIETPGGTAGIPEAELRVLKHAYALELQQLLRNLKNKSAAQNIGERTEGYSDAPVMSLDANTGSDAQVDSSAFAGSSVAVGQGTNESTLAGLAPNGAVATSLQEETYDYRYQLSAGELMKAALTSLNLGIVLVFLFGIYSFADEVLNVFNPNLYDNIIDSAVNQYESVSIMATIILIVVVMLFVWLLSIVLYLIKFGDYQINRKEDQISVSYGLLEKKSFIFDKNKIQAVVMDENPLRQWLGFAELKVQVITSSAMEQLVIHPFVRKKDLLHVLGQLVPDREFDLREQLHRPPTKAYSTFIFWPILITAAIIVGTAFMLQWNALWFLLLLPILLVWEWICMRSSGVWLEHGRLIMRKRSIIRTTYFVERKNVITVKIKTSPNQRRKKLSTIKVQVLGSAYAYSVKSINNEHNQAIWKWFSRHKNVGE